MPATAQFVTDAEGRRTAVILPIEEWEDLMEDLHLGQAARDSKDEERRPFAAVMAEMLAADEIDV